MAGESHFFLQFVALLSLLRSVAGYLGLALVFLWGGTPRGGLIAVFRDFFCWCWQNFYVGAGTGRWAIILGGLDTFLIFPNFLRSSVLSRSATRIYHVY